MAIKIANCAVECRHSERRGILTVRDCVGESQRIGARAARVVRSTTVIERQGRRAADRQHLTPIQRQRERLTGTVIACIRGSQ